MRETSRWLRLVVVGSLASSGCAHTGWEAEIMADPRAVATALGDPPPDVRSATGALPHLEPPHHARMCCALGMDLAVDFAGLAVPFFEIGNVVGVEELGVHLYDLPDGTPDPEGNGLVYTCRGGVIDTAHVRESADNFLFLALGIAGSLRTGSTLAIPGHGAAATITVRAVPEALVEREGAFAIASELAAWTAFRISVWHEVSTGYGYEMVAGFSERPSAFSPEDLYSNALGIRLGAAILEQRGFATDEEYDRLVGAYLVAALERLEAQPRDVARAIMASLDGRWWDSTRRLPDNLLVLRRAFPGAEDRVRPWRAEDAFAAGDVPAVLAAACRGARTRSLALPTGVGHLAAHDLVSITWAPEGWAEHTLPFADASHPVVDERELERLVADVRDDLETELGRGFDQPGPRAATE